MRGGSAARVQRMVVGQLLRYIGWLERSLADEGQEVPGIILGSEISEDLKLACARVPGVRLFEHETAVTMKTIAG